MSVLCQLSLKKGGTIYVNPELVRFVAAAPDDGTLINFTDGKGLVVAGEPQRVASMLSLARNATPKRPPPRPRPQPS